jgi:hypothetical protein
MFAAFIALLKWDSIIISVHIGENPRAVIEILDAEYESAYRINALAHA